MRLAYSLALLVVIPLVALWAAGMAIHATLHQGLLLIQDAWQ